MRRRAFTLIELLVVVTIIGILAAVVLGAVHRAKETARGEATRATIAKIHRVIADVWVGYRTRRVPIAPTSRLQRLPQFHVNGDINLPLVPDFPQQIRRLQTNARRELMRLELPDRWSDVLTPPLILIPPISAQYWGSGARATYEARRRTALQRGATEGQVELWASAELLYLIVAYHRQEGVRFHDSEISDIDQDGLREFSDGWGRPIVWRRWPAGFLPDLEVRDTFQNRGTPPDDDPEQLTGDGWQVMPLIFSAGPDGLYDINRGTEAGGTYAYRLDAGGNLNPCQADLHDPPLLIGQPADSAGPHGEPANGVLNHHDNIHNHDITPK